MRVFECVEEGRVVGGVWFPCDICMRGVCVCEKLRIELEVEIGGSAVGAIVECWCVGKLECVLMYVFVVRPGCSVVLCLVLVLRCVRVVEYVMGC